MIMNQLLKGIVLLFCGAVLLSCSKNEEVDPVDDADTLQEKVENLELSQPGEADIDIEVEPGSETKTENGFKFKGSIGASLEKDGKFNIADGQFEFKVDANGKVINISGEGTVDFPNVGVFGEILKTFAWEKVKSHIEYKKGSYYKEEYKTDIPLNDDRKYFHFKVFDESKDEYALKSTANELIYSFYDFYLDIDDPAMFFKLQLWKPGSGGKSEATSVAKKFFEKLKATGKAGQDLGSAPGIVVGISNQATILSSTYDFSKPETFEELYGYNGFDEINSHGYMKLKNVPIPSTFALRFTGDMYIHGPFDKLSPTPTEIQEKGRSAFVDWFNENEIGPVARTINGSMDFGGKGIGIVLGLLPGINDVVDYDVFNNDFNFDIVGAVYQEQTADPNLETPSFVRFGGEVRRPILGEIFGEKISKYIGSQPIPNGFIYFNIEDDPEKWSVFIESSMEIVIPGIGKREYLGSHFLMNIEGITVEGNLDLPTYGIFNHNSEFKGMIGPEGFELSSKYDQDITLPNGASIASRSLTSFVSSVIDKGFYIQGKADLPLGVLDADLLISFNSEKAIFSSSFSQGMDLGYEAELPSREMMFSTSSDPDEGISYSGEIDVPHIGYNKVEGTLNATTFHFKGEVDRDISFAGVVLHASNASLELRNDGMAIGGSYSLPAGLKTAEMDGSITHEEMLLTGKMATGIKVSNHNFKFSNSYIESSTKTGVKIGGKINLKVFSVMVDGKILPGGNFKMNGVHKYNTKLFKSDINVVVTQNSVDLSGTGTIYGVLGNKLAQGKITFKPNWATGTVSACINGICVDL